MSSPTLLSSVPAVEALRADVRAFLSDAWARGLFEPRCDSWLTGFSRDFSRELGARGWIGLNWPAAYGGRDRPEIERYVVTEELLAAGAPVAAHWIAQRQTGPLLMRFGTEAQKQRFLPAIARGECSFAICMSEPNSGSDLASVRTRAAKVDGGWRVNGRKVWTSHANESDFGILFCRTADATADRHAGLSQLLLDLRAPGVEIRPIRLLNGEEHFSEVTLDDVFIPDDLLVGEIGNGWTQVTSELALERSGPERFMSVMPLLLAFIDATTLDVGARSFSDERRVEVTGWASAQLYSLRALSLGVVDQIAAGQDAAVDAALTKDLGTRFEQECVERIRASFETQPDGPLGAMLAQAVAASPNFTLRGGTNEILRGIVAESLVAS
jgi:acyl-CoA dehydrogenase